MKNQEIFSHGRTRTNTDNLHVFPGEAAGLMTFMTNWCENPFPAAQWLEKVQPGTLPFFPGRSIPRLKSSPGLPEEITLAWLCRLFSWAEISASLDITAVVADTITTFQMQETIIEPKDSLPLPWGIVSYLSAAAAYNAICIINTFLSDDHVDKKSTHDMLDLWFMTTLGLVRNMKHMTEKEGKRLLDNVIPAEGVLTKVNPDHILKEIQTVRIKSGDNIFLHSLHKGFLKYREMLRSEREELVPLLEKSLKTAKTGKPGIIGRFFSWLQQLFSRSGDKPKDNSTGDRITRLNTMIPRLNHVLKAWETIDPLGKILGKKPGEQDIKSIAPVFALPDAQGFQYWLMKRIVPLCPLFENDTSGPVPGALFFPQAILEIAKSSADSAGAAHPGDKQKWAAYLSLVRFYSSWLAALPPLQDIEKRLVFPTTKQKDRYREPFKPFFEPWVELKRECEGIKLSLGLYREGDIELTLLREYNELQKQWDKPVEYWQGKEVKIPAQKFRCLHDYFLNVRGTPIINENHIQGGDE